MIKSEEYEIAGYIKKICVCELCNQVMDKTHYDLMSYPPIYVMKCPKCNKEEWVNPNDLQDQFILRKKDV